MIKIIAYIGSWSCYWLGHIISLIMNQADIFGYMYFIYHALMCWSIDIQDWGNITNGPWKPLKHEREKP